MKRTTKAKILEWVWEWSCKILNYNSSMPIYPPDNIPPIKPHYDLYSTKVQLAQYCFMILRQDIPYWDKDKMNYKICETITKGLLTGIKDPTETNEIVKDTFAIKIEQDTQKNGDLMIRALFRFVPWKED